MNEENTNGAVTAALDAIAKTNPDWSCALQKGGLIKGLIKGVMERALEAELSAHLGYEKHQRSAIGNSRNGVTHKTVHSEQGAIEVRTPRDREGSFEPKLLPKGKTRIDGLDDKIISLYAKGLGVADIQEQLFELYGTNVSTSLISSVTNAVLDEVRSWQCRPLERLYMIAYVDCLMIKVRQDKRIINKALYVVLGVGSDGHKDILGLWINETEGAKFWLSVFTELKNRGLQDILIVCSDNLTGMTDAIAAVYPKADHQLCIVHQIRNSMKYASYKHRKALCADLKPIYTSVNEDEAKDALSSFEAKWGKQYPHIAKSWYDNWDHLVLFLQYPEEIRRIIYTTNAIESLNNQLRKVTRNKRVFPNDDAALKAFYLVIESILKKWTMPIRNWNEALAHFMIKFPDRLDGLV